MTVHAEAERRYFLDAEFHAEVGRAVNATLASYPTLHGVGNFAREVATNAVAFALHLRDTGTTKPRPCAEAGTVPGSTTTDDSGRA